MKKSQPNFGFWKNLQKKAIHENRPILALAPMADVTDAANRKIIAKYGKPDVMFTEFVSVDGLVSVGKEKLLIHLKYSAMERPIVAQLFGTNPDHFHKAAKLCVQLKFDGIDINMGCPEKKIIKQGACGALIKNPTLAQKIILAAKNGAGKIPISVKTRIGFSQNEIETWIPTLLETEPAAISIHGRTVKEMSKVPADWDIIGRAAEIRNAMGSKTLILGNGDAKNLKDAYGKAKKYAVDGVMIGRAVLGNPWFFCADASCLFDKKNQSAATTEETLRVLLEHTKLFETLLGKHKNFGIMKKHYKAYLRGFKGAKTLRIQLMETKNVKEVQQIINQFQIFGK